MQRISAARWGVAWASWWSAQWTRDGSFSLGIHVEPHRRVGDAGLYGPYVDLHVGPVVLSVGRHPAGASGLVARYGQDCVMRPEVTHVAH